MVHLNERVFLLFVGFLLLPLVVGCTAVANRPSESPGRAKVDPRLPIKLERQATFVSNAPSLDSPAPDLTLKTLEGQTVDLAQLQQGKILVLEFGNYTCPPFRRRTPFVQAIAKRYADQVSIATVYSREANAGHHPYEDVAPPQTLEERVALAKAYASEYGIAWPVVVDEMDDRAFRAYGEPFTATFIVDRDGRIAFKGTWVPPRIVEAELKRLLGLPGSEEPLRAIPSPQTQARASLRLNGLVCGGCVIAVKNALTTTPGVLDAEVSLERQKATVAYDPTRIAPEEIAQAVRNIGFGAYLPASRSEGQAGATAQVAKE